MLICLIEGRKTPPIPLPLSLSLFFFWGGGAINILINNIFVHSGHIMFCQIVGIPDMISIFKLFLYYQFFVDKIFVRSGHKMFRQIIGIPMGSNCTPLIVDLFLYCYESQFMDKPKKRPFKALTY